ncbi:MAG: FeoA family protein [Sulfuricurvum sp.]|jgi:ferrous iron transport protein A
MNSGSYLNEFEKGSKLKIIAILAEGELKKRLISFGLIKGERVEIVEYAPSKTALKVQVGKSSIALRRDEAKMIKVVQNG